MESPPSSSFRSCYLALLFWPASIALLEAQSTLPPPPGPPPNITFSINPDGEIVWVEPEPTVSPEARMQARQAALEPFRVEPLSDLDSQPTTFAGMMSAQRQRLSLWLANERLAQPAREARLQQLKESKGWPERLPSPSGSSAVLVGERNGSPIYYSTYNLNASDTISTDEVWPGGANGLDLDGEGTVIGLWDEDAVRATHDEFRNRVTQRDDATNLNFHATGTAGTLVAEGRYSLNLNGQAVAHAARGASYAANLDAYDFFDDTLEMPAAAMDDLLRLSNHSYGLPGGWLFTTLQDDLGNLFNAWVWFGDTAISNDEDARFGSYRQDFSNTLDQIVYDANGYLPVFAAGNERGEGPAVQPVDHYALVNGVFTLVTGITRQIDGGANGFDTLSPQASAKNVLSVGACEGILGGYNGPASVVLADFSSIGPTDDGRIKPDLVAKGVQVVTTHSGSNVSYQIQDGTSFSAPSVTGSINLLRQHFHSVYAEDYPMLASTMKGVAIHTADEAGNPGPDYSFGWGLLNTASAADLVADDIASDAHPHIKEVTLSNGGTISFPVTPNRTEPLRVTICWSDPPGNPPAETLDPVALMLRNDLDLRVIAPNGDVHQPWVLNPANPGLAATTGDNFRDNVEQVLVATPSSGDYTVAISHKGILVDARQIVSIVVSGNLPTEAPDPRALALEQTGNNQFDLIWPTVVGANYRLETSTDLANWTVEGGEISPLTTSVAVPLSTPTAGKFYRIIRLR